jgi:hypothetical protein
MTAPPRPPIQKNKQVVRNSKRQPSYTELAFPGKRPLLANAEPLSIMQAYAPRKTKEKVSWIQDSEQRQRESSEEVFARTTKSRV